jgi:hypothetical protein
MMFRLHLATGLLMLAPALAPAQTDPALWRFVQPNAKAIISIDWKHVRQSHVGTMLREKWIDANSAAIPGAEFLNDVDRFLISSGGLNTGDEPSEPPMLIVVQGHFDLLKVRKLLQAHGTKAQAFNSFQVYRPQGKNAKDMAFAMLDAQIILIGDARSVFAGLDRSTALATVPDASPVLARAAAMDATYEVWALITSPGALANDRLMGLLSGGESGSNALGYEVGFSFKNGLSADASVLFESDSASKRLASELGKMLKMAIKDKMGEPAMLDLEKKLKVSADGKMVKIAMHLTAQELEKNAQIYATTHRQSAPVLAELRTVARPASEPPKTERRVIRIEGLDEGTREIPYKQDRPPQP